jgi:hypothetical protein
VPRLQFWRLDVDPEPRLLFLVSNSLRKQRLSRFGFVVLAQIERLLPDSLANPPIANALDTDPQVFHFTARQTSLDGLKIGHKTPLGDAGNLRTNPAQILGFTAGFHHMANLRSFAANFTNP